MLHLLFSIRQSVLKRVLAASVVIATTACGGGGGGGDTPGGGGPLTATGSVVYSDTERVSGRLERVIKVMNIATRAATMYVAGDFIKGGPSVSQGGTIAHMIEGDDVVEIKLTRLNGQFIRSFTYAEELTFPLSGAAISPDGLRVAFAQNRFSPDIDAREDAVYVCNTSGTPSCKFYFNLRDPGWLGNSKLVAVSGNDQKRLFTIDVVSDTVRQTGATQTSKIQNPTGTPDGQYIVFNTDGVGDLVAMNISTGATRNISRDGVGPFKAQVSPDGRTLAYLEQCCGSASTGGTFAGGPALRAVPFDVNGVFTAGVTVNLVRDAQGNPIPIRGGEYGITPAVN